MEVFMRNLPADLSSDGLADNLRPFITVLGLPDSFSCQKRRHKKFGSVTFFHERHVTTFLDKYGEVPVMRNGVPIIINGKPKTKPRLHLMGNNVYCTLGNSNLSNIDVRAISYHAKREQEQRQWAARQGPREHASGGGDVPVVFQLWYLRCGHLVYPDDNLHFHPDLSWEQSREGATAKFAKATVIITLSDSTRFDIPYNIIHELVVSNSDSSLTFTLQEPPRIFRPRPGLQGGVIRERIPAYNSVHQTIIGASLVYRIETAPPEFHQNVSKLHRKTYLSEVITMSYLPSLSPLALNSAKSMSESLAELKKMLSAEPANGGLPFEILFQLQALAWNAYLLPETVIELAKVLRKRVGTSQEISALALKRLFPDISFPGPGVPAKILKVESIVEYLDDNQEFIAEQIAEEKRTLGHNPNLTRIYKATVTPTHITLHGPEIEGQNRVLRKFPGCHEYFVRIQFADEDGQDVRYIPRVSLEHIYQRFKDILSEKGVFIGGRSYGFLGFSHSSLRSHSAWFLAPFTYDQTLHFYDKLIKDLGDFSAIPIVAKCAARIGQAFSETPFAVPMREYGIEHTYIEDVHNADRSRCFSDGVGKISIEAMYTIWDKLPGNRKATVFQIRFGGCKGLLALDPTIEGSQICIRKDSMEKFESNDKKNLEICDMASRPIRLVLNRQNIKILEDMGVGADWFFYHQRIEMDRLQCVTKSIYNSAVFMDHHSIGDNVEFPKFLRRLDRIGLDYRTDKMLSSIVEAVVFRELRLLKHKARIPVSEGITLFGIMDETGFLEEGEVFVTYHSSDKKFTSPPEDGVPMIVTRSPALHPGDIQVAINRWPPDDHPLWTLNNCVVFNQKGKRDLPSMLSGGDLDGDMYNVIWDKRLFEYAIETFDPADYERPQPVKIDREVKRDDMANFFVEFMETDQLGLIAVRHMILADQKEEGSLNQDCKTLAELHSAAVDFSKTGIPADVKVLGKIKLQRPRPDFLAPARPAHLADRAEILFDVDPAPIEEASDEEDGAARFIYYASDKVLGRLYRAINEHDIWHNSARSSQHRDKHQMWEKLRQKIHWATNVLGLKWTQHREEAVKIRRFYDDGLKITMIENGETPHRPLSEVETFTGQILNPRGAMTRRQKDRSDHLKEAFDRISSHTWKMIRDRARKAPTPDLDTMSELSGYSNLKSTRSAPNRGDKDVLELALACFNVSLLDGSCVGRHYGNNSDGEWQVETFRIVAANVFLKELEMFENTSVGAAISGGFVGVSGVPSSRIITAMSAVGNDSRRDRGIRATTNTRMENRGGSRTSNVATSSRMENRGGSRTSNVATSSRMENRGGSRTSNVATSSRMENRGGSRTSNVATSSRMENRGGSQTSNVATSPRNGLSGGNTATAYQQIRDPPEVAQILYPFDRLAVQGDSSSRSSGFVSPPATANVVRPVSGHGDRGLEADGGVRL